MEKSIVGFSLYDDWHSQMLEKFRQEYFGVKTNLSSHISNQELYVKF